MRTNIPKIFHFVFGLKKQTEPFHLAYYLCIESCIKVNHPDAVMFHYYYLPYGYYWELIKKKVILVKVNPEKFAVEFDYKDKLMKKFSYAPHSDFIRLKIIENYGGVYADIDTIFVNPLPGHLFEKNFVLGKERDAVIPGKIETKPSLCNAVIMAEKKADFTSLWRNNMKNAFDGTWNSHSTLLAYSLSQLYPELIHIEPERSFYHFDWTREGIYDLLEGLVEDTNGIYSIHLWAHLWWSRRRKDFSNFHNWKLTEDFILKNDTTYNVIARKYLPEKKKHDTILSKTMNLINSFIKE